MPYLSLVFLMRSEKPLTNFLISCGWANLKLEDEKLGGADSQPARRRMQNTNSRFYFWREPPDRYKRGFNTEEREAFYYRVIECVITLASTSHNPLKLHSYMLCHNTSKYFSEPVSVNSFTKEETLLTSITAGGSFDPCQTSHHCFQICVNCCNVPNYSENQR